MKTFVAFLLLKAITEVQFEGMEPEAKADLYKEYNSEMKSYIETLEKNIDGKATKQDLETAVKAFNEGKSEEMRLLGENMKTVMLTMKSLGEKGTKSTIEKGLKFYTLGENAFVDARDVADAMVLMMQSSISKERYLVTGTNISFRDAFSKIAIRLNKKPATIYASPLLSGIVWRFYALASFFGIRPTITKETAASAHRKTRYDSSKFISTFNFTFREIDDTIDNAVKGRIY